MSAAAAHDPSPDEERRSPPVTLTEVLAACEELELAGIQITRRSVREKLGRGSMTTIHNGVSQYETRLASAPPSIDLTQEDRNVIADLGARALAVAEGRVERILAQRETALQSQVAAANARADDAITAAEASVSEAQRHTLEALATSEAARLERDQALSEAEAAKQHALRLEGQLAQLTIDRDETVARSVAVEQELVEIKSSLSAEVALRRRSEADTLTSAEALKTAQADHAAKIGEQTEQISRLREALASEQGRHAEMMQQRLHSDEALKRLEAEFSIRSAEVSRLQSDLAVAGASLMERDQTVQELEAALSTEQAKAQQLDLILKAIGEHTDAVRSLQESLSSPNPIE